MPRPSSSSSAARFLDKQEVLARLIALARQALASDPNIREVRLFGSLAKDAYTPRSDADLLIVLESDTRRRRMDRIPEYLKYFQTAPVPVDIFPYTRAEIEAAEAEGDLFVERILREGIVLAGR